MPPKTSAVKAKPRAKTRAKSQKPPPGPDDVVRQSAGSYASGDGRYEIRQSDANWFLVDLQQSNEFGQELIHGPFGSLKQARAALPGARDVTPLLRSTPRRPTSAKKPKPAPSPASWLDKLPEKEAVAARALIRALEREGMQDAEKLVRVHREDHSPEIATRLVEHRLAGLIDEIPEAERQLARNVMSQVLEILTVRGNANLGPLPRWALLQLDDETSTSTRSIRPRPPI